MVYDIFGYMPVIYKTRNSSGDALVDERKKAVKLLYNIVQRIADMENVPVLLQTIRKSLERQNHFNIEGALQISDSLGFHKREAATVKTLITDILNLSTDRTVRSERDLYRRLENLLEALPTYTFTKDSVDLKARILRLPDFNFITLSNDEKIPSSDKWVVFTKEQLEKMELGDGRKRLVHLSEQLEWILRISLTTLGGLLIGLFAIGNGAAYAAVPGVPLPVGLEAALVGVATSLSAIAAHFFVPSPELTQREVSNVASVEQERIQIQGLERMARLLAFEGKKIEDAELKRGIEAALGRFSPKLGSKEKFAQVKEILRVVALLKGLNETGVGVKNPTDEYVKKVLERLFKTVQVIPVESELLTSRFETASKGEWHSQEISRLEILFADWTALGLWAKRMANRDPLELKRLSKGAHVYDLSSLFKTDANSAKEEEYILKALSNEVLYGTSRVVLVADRQYPFRDTLREKLSPNVFDKLYQEGLEQAPGAFLSTVGRGNKNKIYVEDVCKELERAGLLGERVQIFTGSGERWLESADKSLRVEIYELDSETMAKPYLNLTIMSEDLRRIKVLKIQL